MENEEPELINVVRSAEPKPLLEKYDIPIDHLSFEYIRDCTNAKELEHILLVLRSGEEGIFPDLTRYAENRLIEVSPNSKLLRVELPIRTMAMLEPQERTLVDEDMINWLKEMQTREKDLEEGNALCSPLSIPQPEIRQPVEPRNDLPSKGRRIKAKRIASCDYAEWDKFDADTELDRIDLQEEKKQIEAKRIQSEHKEEIRNARKSDVTATIDKLSLTATELSVMAENERNRGNESYKAGDYMEALSYYNSSIAINPTINVYNNRSITYIKLQRYQDAINDCDVVLNMEDNNLIALLRRGLALEHLEKKSEAVINYQTVLELEPSNRTAISALSKLIRTSNLRKIEEQVD